MTTHPRLSDCLHCAMRDRSIFAGLSLDDLRDLGMEVHDISVPATDMLYLEGDRARYAYTLREGAVKLVKTLANGRAQIVRLLHHGDLFGFEGLRETAYQHSAIALTRTDLCQLDLVALEALSRRLPSVHDAINQRWFNALQQAETRIVELGAKKADERLATFLSQWCSAYPAGDAVPFPLTRQELGEFLGLSTEHVSRLMAEFKRRGLLTERKNLLHIPDTRQLILHACASGACA
jgi:CRP/FNR family transcriptional regulator, anaerobic regulatory protein